MKYPQSKWLKIVSVADKIIEALKSYKSTGEDGSKNEYRKLHLQLKVYHI